MSDDDVRRWPAVYDQDQLVDMITKAANAARGQFYSFTSIDQKASQGDVVALSSELPVIDADGEPSADRPVEYWLVVGNSCDVERAYEDKIDYVSMAPMVPLSALNETFDAETSLRKYETGRTFFVPGWESGIEPHVADFTKLVPMHRLALRGRATIKGRMTQHSWFLLNACLVRLLARDDERNV